MSDNVVKIFPEKEKMLRGNRLRWLLFSFLLLVLLVLILWFSLSQSTRLDGIKRFFRYLGRDADYGSFSFEAYGQSSCAQVDSHYALASQNGLTLYAADGEVTMQLETPLTAPAIKTAEDKLVLYDIGGTSLYVYAADGTQYYAVTLPSAILDADVTADGESSVVYAGTDCRAILAVYSKNGKLLYRRNSKQQYLGCCSLSPNAATVASAALGQADFAFQSSLHLYSTDSEKESASIVLGEELPSVLRFTDDERLCCISESTVSFFTLQGKQLHSYSPEPDTLLYYAFGADGYVSVLYDTYAEQGRYKLMLFSPDGDTVAVTALSEAPLSVSAAGRYTAVLTTQALYLYDRSLALCSSTENAGYSHALARTDGTALLLGDGTAKLFIPK